MKIYLYLVILVTSSISLANNRCMPLTGANMDSVGIVTCLLSSPNGEETKMVSVLKSGVCFEDITKQSGLNLIVRNQTGQFGPDLNSLGFLEVSNGDVTLVSLNINDLIQGKNEQINFSIHLGNPTLTSSLSLSCKFSK